MLMAFTTSGHIYAHNWKLFATPRMRHSIATHATYTMICFRMILLMHYSTFNKYAMLSTRYAFHMHHKRPNIADDVLKVISMAYQEALRGHMPIHCSLSPVFCDCLPSLACLSLSFG